MTNIIMLDRGAADSVSLGNQPLGGAETAFIELAQALSQKGHKVIVRNNGTTIHQTKNLDWAPLGNSAGFLKGDIVIANRDSRLFSAAPGIKKKILWIHNTARYLLHWQHLSRLLWFRPTIIFSGAYHLSTYPRWAPSGGRVIIPYGISDLFRRAEVDDRIPPPRAIFTSNPLRSLAWLLDLWSDRIHPQVPGTELHLFSGPQTYGNWGQKVAPLMAPVLEKAKMQANNGVVLHSPVPKQSLVKQLRASRVLLYRGDFKETFCLAVAEAQAVGVPSVIQDRGSVAERIVDNVTGFVAKDDEEFANRAVKVLTDDELWLRQHQASLELQRNWSWKEAAEAFETLLD